MLRSAAYKLANLWQNPRILSGATTFLIALIVITPLCGLMFDCGCTWPWDGLHRNCNFYEPRAMAKCPWCVSLAAGFTSVVLSICCGVWGASIDLSTAFSATGLKIWPKRSWGIPGYIQRICRGLLIFLLTAVLSGWATASLQGSYFFLH
jgi:hypothetical protein